MSFLVLVLGTLLSFGGAAALYSGYGNFEVARGWTAVIAGTTALSAGVMTIAISFVLRCLVRLQASLEIERGLAVLLNEIAVNRDLGRARSTGVEGSGAPVVQPTVLVASASFRVGGAEAGDSSAAEEAAQPRGEAPVGVGGGDNGADRPARAQARTIP
jgi:hypothetical protein